MNGFWKTRLVPMWKAGAVGCVCILVALVLLAVPSKCATFNPLEYTGEYVDLIAQEEMERPLEEGGRRITKVNAETGHAICMSLSCNSVTLTSPTFVYQGEPMQLRFENNILTGCRRYKQMPLQGLLEDEWDTDPDTLKTVLTDYTAQVQSLDE